MLFLTIIMNNFIEHGTEEVEIFVEIKFFYSNATN